MTKTITYIGDIDRQDKDDHEWEVPGDEAGQGDNPALLTPVSIAMEQVCCHTAHKHNVHSKSC